MIKKILLVDDINFIVKFQEEILSSLSKELQLPFQIHTANDVQEALAYIEQNTYDIMVVDMSLPDGQGLDIAQKAKAKNSHIAIAILTLFEEKEEMKKYAKILLKKPITPTLYKKAITSLLGL